MNGRGRSEGAMECYVTLATNDFYAYGCIVLGHSLRKTKTTRKLVALITNDVSWNISQILQSVYNIVERVPKLDVEYVAFGQYSHPDFSTSLAKIHCWRLTQFSKCVFINADCLVLQNCDELFERSEFSAVPDVGWPDFFNSGIFVFEPSTETYWNLINLVKERWLRDGGDQHILNLYFNQSWKSDIHKRLPFIYNLVCSCIYTYAPAFQQFGKGVKITHFLGCPKPWDSVWNSNDKKMSLSSDINPIFRPFHQIWLDIFNEHVLPSLAGLHAEITNESCGMAEFMSNLSSQTKSEIEHIPPHHQISWTPDFRSKSPPLILKPLSLPSQKQHYFPSVTQNTAPSQTSNYSCPRLSSRQRSPPPGNILPMEHRTPSPKNFSSPEYGSSPEQRSSDTDCQENRNIHLFEEFKSDILPLTEKFQELGELPDSHSSVSHSFNEYEIKESAAYTDQPEVISTNLSSEIEAQKDDEIRMKQWEEGKADYLGKDTFDNIWKRISNIIDESPKEPHQQIKSQLNSAPQEIHETPLPTTSSGTIITVDNKDLPATVIEKSSNTFYRVDNKDFETTITGKSSNPFRLPGYAMDDYTGMHEWEQGRIDYAGRDSSENIIKRLDFLIANKNHWTNFRDPFAIIPSLDP